MPKVQFQKIVKNDLKSSKITIEKQGKDEDEEFIDSDGEVDYEAIKKIKKRDVEKFTDMKEMDHKEQKYTQFSKQFYTEDEGVKRMSRADVDARRYYFQTKRFLPLLLIEGLPI